MSQKAPGKKQAEKKTMSPTVDTKILLEIYRKLFRYAELKELNTQSARLTVMARMYQRGADEDQVGTILRIAERSAVRERMPRPKPTLDDLLEELI